MSLEPFSLRSPRAWYQRFTSFITFIGFTYAKSDTSLFILYGAKGTPTFLLLYVNDIMLTPSSTRLLDMMTTSLRSEFAMMDMGSLHYFLSIAVTYVSTGEIAHSK
jgi:hypothetical protein